MSNLCLRIIGIALGSVLLPVGEDELNPHGILPDKLWHDVAIHRTLKDVVLVFLATGVAESRSGLHVTVCTVDGEIQLASENDTPYLLESALLQEDGNIVPTDLRRIWIDLHTINH